MQDQIAAVRKMTGPELLDYVIANPHYLLYPFYEDLAKVIRQRRKELAESSLFIGKRDWYWAK
jgi:hypothetical protein